MKLTGPFSDIEVIYNTQKKAMFVALGNKSNIGKVSVLMDSMIVHLRNREVHILSITKCGMNSFDMNFEMTQMLSNLSELNLSGNNLLDLPNAFVGLKNLKTLDLSSNQFEQVPLILFRLPSLQVLKMNSNKLSQVPYQIGSLTNLGKLELNCNLLNELPRVIGDLQNLRELHADCNKLNGLPDSFGELKLLTLSLSNNRFVEIPKCIFKITNLWALFLFGNNLESLPNEIVQLTNLNCLKFGGCMDTLPDGLCALKKLQHLQVPSSCMKWTLGKFKETPGLQIST